MLIDCGPLEDSLSPSWALNGALIRAFGSTRDRFLPPILPRKYSANQKIGSFHYVHKTSFGNYSFVCVDATLTPGPKRPYNFFGILEKVRCPASAESRPYVCR